nr:MAG TPA: Scaffold protein [Microviridae sp.]
MNKRYEEGRKPFFSNSGKTERKQYVWAKDKDGEEYLEETESIDIQAEIESYADECDIKSIVRKASFDPEFLKSLSQGATNGTEMDITEWPTNIHEYHKMVATTQANMMKLEELQKAAKETSKTKNEVKEEENEQK